MAIKASEKVGQLAERRARKQHGRNAGGKRAAETEAAAPAGGRGEVGCRESEKDDVGFALFDQLRIAVA